jgi:cytochrome c
MYSTFPFFQNRKSFLALMLMAFFFSCQKPNESAVLIPEENRFTTSILTKPGELDEPMEMTFLKDGRILIAERKGGIKSFDQKTGEIKTIGKINVNTKYTSKDGRVTEAEEGLMGIIAHPNFDQNHWIFLYYAHPTETKHRLSRFELLGDSLNMASERVVLDVETQRETCCHTGGGMAFDKDGNLFLTTGNNTANPISGTSNLDERPDHSSADDQRTGGNTNDLRGKILRIHPKDDGTYTIPKGNLFPEGTEKTRPEIYTMGRGQQNRVYLLGRSRARCFQGFHHWASGL